MKLLITVPTYWRPQEEAGVGIYDHPTPIGKESTLSRLLDSLISVASTVPVAVIVAVTDPMFAEAAAEQVRKIIEPYHARLHIALFSQSDLRFLTTRISELGYVADGIDIVGYGNVRNFHLIIGGVLGVDALIGLDDDEAVPPEYLSRVNRFLGKEHEGEPILGVVGPYREESSLPIHDSNPLLERGSWIKKGISALAASGEEPVKTSIGFGGNIVIHRDLFTRLPFDPHIARGEDIDYITTCRMYGYSFWWDHSLFVHHFPPDRFRRPACTLLQEDIARFIYSREKLAAAALRGLPVPDDLDPYPERFLREDLVQMSLQALHAICPGKRPARAFVDTEILRASDEARKYFEFQSQWEELMARIRTDGLLSEYIRSKFEIWRRTI